MSGFEVTEVTFQDAVPTRSVGCSPLRLPNTSFRAVRHLGEAARRAAGLRASLSSNDELNP